MMISLVILKKSAAGLSITLVVTPVSGFVKFQQQDGTEIWQMPQKSVMSLSERWLCRDRKVLCTAEEMSWNSQSKFWADLASPAVCSPVCQWSHHRAMSAWHCSPWWQRDLAGTCLPSAPSLIPAGALQAQGYLPHLCKTQAAMEKCLSPVSGGILPCQWWHFQSSSTLCFSRGKFVSLWSWKWCPWDIHYLWFWRDKL